jgi:hypothetical protein
MGSLSPDLRRQLQETFSRMAELHRQIENWVDLLLGDIYERYPGSLEEGLLKAGMKQDQIEKMDQKERVEAYAEYLNNRPTRLETMGVALDLIFGALWGWTREEIDQMTFPEIYIALEHALDYDAKTRPSVWEVTK